MVRGIDFPQPREGYRKPDFTGVIITIIYLILAIPFAATYVGYPASFLGNIAIALGVHYLRYQQQQQN